MWYLGKLNESQDNRRTVIPKELNLIIRRGKEHRPKSETYEGV